jgi:hypothetical protein
MIGATSAQIINYTIGKTNFMEMRLIPPQEIGRKV